MRRYKKTIVYKEESRLFYLAVSACCFVVCAYAYFVSVSVVNVVMRKEADAHIAATHTALSALEAEYIELQHSVSNDVAEMKGFVIARNKYFIDTNEETLVLSRN